MGIGEGTPGQWEAEARVQGEQNIEMRLLGADFLNCIKRLEEFYATEEAVYWMLAPQEVFDGKSASQLLMEDDRAKVHWWIDTLDELPYV